MRDSKMESPRLSFKGYRFAEALYRNKDLVKGLIVIIVGYSYMTGFDFPTFAAAVGAGVIALAGKLVLDAWDYFTSVVQVPDSVIKS